MAAPTYYTSKYGTKVNTTGITGKPLQKIQGLADTRYGTQAQKMAERQRNLLIPKAPGAPTAPVAGAPVNPNAARQQTRLDYLQRVRPNDPQIKILKSKMVQGVPAAIAPAPVGPLIEPTNFANIENAGPLPTPAPGPAPGTTETLFPSTRMFEPQNYEGSPLYKFQVQEGQKQLAKSLAAKGLTNSGSAIEQELNIPLRVAAQDTDRMTRIASENADRLKSFQDNEALRLERAGNNQWDRSYSLASLMAQQSPWAGALAGLNNTADIRNDAGQAQANFLKDYYQRIMADAARGGSGNSGAARPAPTPVALPTGPDFTNIAPTQIGGNYASNQGWLNLLAQGLSGIF